MAARKATLSDTVFDGLRAFIRKHTGIWFRSRKRYLLESCLRRRLKACEVPDYETYLRYLRRGDDPDEITHLVNAVTINETSFFRHAAQFTALERALLPALVRQHRRRGSRRVRLWSAACSTGDEAYSLAILIKERVQPCFPDMRFEIVATDIDTERLAAARTGCYRQRAVRNVPKAYLSKFFQRSGKETYLLHRSVRNMVTFRRLNLVDEQAVRRMRNFDVIMCANVLIYFEAATKQRVLQALRRALRPGGYLFVGGSEALGNVAARFTPVRSGGVLAYQRLCDTASNAMPPAKGATRPPFSAR